MGEWMNGSFPSQPLELQTWVSTMSSKSRWNSLVSSLYDTLKIALYYFILMYYNYLIQCLSPQTWRVPGDQSPGLINFSVHWDWNQWYVCVHVLNRFSCVLFFVTPWTVSSQACLSMGSSKKEYWSGLPCPPPGIFPTHGSIPRLLGLLGWQTGSLPLMPPGKPPRYLIFIKWANDWRRQIWIKDINW